MSEHPETGVPRQAGSRLPLGIFTVALVVAAVATVLTAFVDPAVWGISDESIRILYMGGLGLVAGFAGLVTVLSGLALAVQLYAKKQVRIGRATRWLVIVVAVIILAAVIVRFYPR
jgi:hypothetical protein